MSLISLEYIDVFDENRTKKLEFSKSLLPSSCNASSLFVLRVDGESMQPLILNRALVVADLSQKEFVAEDIYIVSKDGKFWVKKAKEQDNKKEFISLNEKFAHLVYPFEEVRIIAKVVLTFTRL